MLMKPRIQQVAIVAEHVPQQRAILFGILMQVFRPRSLPTLMGKECKYLRNNDIKI